MYVRVQAYKFTETVVLLFWYGCTNLHVHTYVRAEYVYFLSNVPYKNLLRNITNTSFCNSTPVWIQACLPMRQGRQHIRSAAQDANSTSIASAVGSSHLVSKVFSSHLHKVQQCCQRRATVFITRPDTLFHCQGYFPGTALRWYRHTITLASSPAVCNYVSYHGLQMDYEILALLWIDLGNSLCHLNECSYCKSKVNVRVTHSLSC